MPNATFVKFQLHEETNGCLCVFESNTLVPFSIQRVFTVSAKSGDVRGDHAHKRCSQLLVCVSGRIHVTCDNGTEVNEYVLDKMNRGLLVPPTVWARQEYLEDDAVLMVLCDRSYEPDDYIRDYDEFTAYVKAGSA